MAGDRNSLSENINQAKNGQPRPIGICCCISAARGTHALAQKRSYRRIRPHAKFGLRFERGTFAMLLGRLRPKNAGRCQNDLPLTMLFRAATGFHHFSRAPGTRAIYRQCRDGFSFVGPGQTNFRPFDGIS